MKTEIKRAWVKALRSGTYKQGRQALKEDGKYCCLGVLCDLHRKACKKKGWLEDEYDSNRSVYRGATDYLPNVVASWAGLDYDDPVVDGKKLSERNDAGDSFNTIAKLIQDNL